MSLSGWGLTGRVVRALDEAIGKDVGAGMGLGPGRTLTRVGDCGAPEEFSHRGSVVFRCGVVDIGVPVAW